MEKIHHFDFEEKIQLPEQTYKKTVTVNRDNDCEKASIDIKAISVWPPPNCASLHASAPDYTSVQSQRKCHYTGPISSRIVLHDSSLLIPSDAYSIARKYPPVLEIAYMTANGTCMIEPQKD